MYRHGTIDLLPRKNHDRKCTIVGCGKKHRGRGFCHKHLKQTEQYKKKRKERESLPHIREAINQKAREVKRIALVEKYAEKRKALKEAGDFEGLQKLPENSCPVRVHNRCKLTGRPRGYMRQFGISRVTFREMANQGLIPGVKKASW